MNALWEKSPLTLSEAIRAIGGKADWSYKTYPSYMLVLERKGFVRAEKRGRDKFYEPAVSKQSCVEQEKRDYLMTLLRLFNRQMEPSLGFAQVQTRRLARKRVKGAFMKTKTRLPAVMAAIVLTLSLLLGCFTTACRRGDAAAAIPGGQQISVVLPSGETVRYSVVYKGADEHSSREAPPPGAADPIETAGRLAELMAAVFGDQIAFQGGDIQILYASHGDVALQVYRFYINDLAAQLNGTANALNGELLSVNNDRAAAQEYDLDRADEIWARYDSADIELAVFEKAASVVEQHLAAGHTLMREHSYADGMQITFQETDPICMDAYMRMDEGPCYGLRLLYPSLQIVWLDIYPLGWTYCKSGTQYTEYLDPWALAELGLMTPAGSEALPSAAAPAPTPARAAEDGAEISDEDYRLIALAVEAM